jgi:hypothetical protein
MNKVISNFLDNIKHVFSCLEGTHEGYTKEENNDYVVFNLNIHGNRVVGGGHKEMSSILDDQ